MSESQSTYELPALHALYVHLQLGNDALSFANPLLLKLLVEWLSGAAAATAAARAAQAAANTSGTEPNISAASGTAGTSDIWLGVAASNSSSSSSIGAATGAEQVLGAQPLWWELLNPAGAYFGWTAAVALGASSIVRALLNSHYNWGLVRRHASWACWVHDAVQPKASTCRNVTCMVRQAAQWWLPFHRLHLQAAPCHLLPRTFTAAPADTPCELLVHHCCCCTCTCSHTLQGRLNCQLRAGLMCILYKKSLLIGPQSEGDQVLTIPGSKGTKRAGTGIAAKAAVAAQQKPANGRKQVAVNSGATGEVATLMSVDAGRVVNLLVSFHELWSLPLQMAVALYLLYLQVSAQLKPEGKRLALTLVAATLDKTSPTCTPGRQM